jgi:hypothetical protein
MPNEALQKKRKSGHRKFINQRRRNLFLRNQSVAISTTTAAASTAATGTVRPTCTAATARAAPLTTATTAAATCARLLGTCFIDGQGTTFNTLSVERSNRCLRFLIGAHFDKTEAFGALRFTISDHLCRSNRTVRGKHLLQITLFHVVAQVAYV